jgi:hypothetical protein
MTYTDTEITMKEKEYESMPILRLLDDVINRKCWLTLAEKDMSPFRADMRIEFEIPYRELRKRLEVDESETAI